MTSPALSRRFVLGYAALWLAGAGFLWWPWLLVRLVLRARAEHRPPLLLTGVAGFLGLSLLLALVQAPPAGRVLGAALNLLVWVCLVLLVAARPSRRQLAEAAAGLVGLALVQAALTLLALLLYPQAQDLVLPLGRLLPDSVLADPSITAFAVTHLAFPDYFAMPVVRSGGILGNPTWGGALAALGILLLLVDPFGRRRPGVRGWALTGAGVVVLLPSLVLSYSRNTVLALLVALVAAGAVLLRRRLGAPGFAALVSLSVAGGVAVLAVLPVPALIASLNGTRAGSAETRGEIYWITLDRVLASPTPLLGSGVKERVPGLVASLGSHSSYLGLLYRGGAVALLLFLAALVVAGWVAWRRGEAAALALVVFTAVWSVAEDVDVGHFVPLALVLALGLLGQPDDAGPPEHPVGAADRPAPVGAAAGARVG
ncbi:MULTISPECIES: O-antigen ligase family protein [unclassified Modestobacter]|uniref:O-antigen ligase family protein n=1 Tax=unclassified Modestobacter TaxID=2643866 RepID=UPI0022AAA859|nr:MULTISPECIES: O-antigen ligase family protein [unclassified Modestobacter]MCZ2825644.1 O-antigen ligase family protein [Modestobacter sp. VKM Ac-2981]MCZ2853291.1 O-antigen ligase family protein [Modestobacter sp. VKM Ac-2982]